MRQTARTPRVERACAAFLGSAAKAVVACSPGRLIAAASEQGANVHTLDQRLAEAGPVLGCRRICRVIGAQICASKAAR